MRSDEQTRLPYQEESGDDGNTTEITKVEVEVVDQAGGVVCTVLPHEGASIGGLPDVLALLSVSSLRYRSKLEGRA